MGIEAFLWTYENGEPAALQFANVLSAFGEAVRSWEPEFGRLQLDFGGPADSCDLFCDKDAAETGRVRSLMISRPVQHAALWQAVLRLLAENNSVLIFSDDPTPRVWDFRVLKHLPADLVASLGTPVQVRIPEDITTRQ